MRLPSTPGVLLTASSLLSAAAAFPAEQDTSVRRALSNAPSGNYAPKNVSCPSGDLLRTATNISTSEQEWLQKRHAVTDKALTDFLDRAGLTDFNVSEFMSGYSPTVALAFSGGGYRAMLNGAGALKAFDSRTENSTATGQLGGLLQSSTYMAGLSGGSWLLGSVVLNNFTTITALQNDGTLWDITHSVLAPDGALHIIDTAEYYNALNDEVHEKEDAGYDVSLTDFWGRALSRQFLNWTDGGPAVTFSSIALTDEFKNAEHPFPIVVADARNPGEDLVSSNTTVFEFNPFEFGSFDPQLYAFTLLEYLGSKLTDGTPVSKNVCVRGFDNGGFVMGTSSSLFNQALLQLSSSGSESILRTFATSVLGSLSEADFDIADYAPNPFYKYSGSPHFPSVNTRDLTLVDGGEDLQNIPLHPLIQPARNVDVIFAVDGSADTLTASGDTTNWPNGTALVATYARSLDGTISNGTLFPAIPDQNTFINLGLNARPTFFGCDGNNITDDPARYPPLLVYLPNSPWTFDSNTTTLTLSYDDDERDGIIANGYSVATQGNGSVADWHACVACAIVHRRVERTGGTQTAQCQKCFENYCWNGTVDSTLTIYNPTVKIATSGAAVARSVSGGVVATTLLTMAVFAWGLM